MIGSKNNTFKIILDNDFVKQNDWLLNYLKILNDPVETKDGFEYEVEIINNIIYKNSKKENE